MEFGLIAPFMHSTGEIALANILTTASSENLSQNQRIKNVNSNLSSNREIILNEISFSY